LFFPDLQVEPTINGSEPAGCTVPHAVVLSKIADAAGFSLDQIVGREWTSFEIPLPPDENARRKPGARKKIIPGAKPSSEFGPPAREQRNFLEV
jgi:hypothetical protein